MKELESISGICPDCVEVLILSSEKFAGKKDWFVCPRCCFRERPKEDLYDLREMNKPTDIIEDESTD